MSLSFRKNFQLRFRRVVKNLFVLRVPEKLPTLPI